MNAVVTIVRDFTIATIDDRLFGSFIEHLGRAVYGGIYEPGHPSADKHGFRTDVIELIQQLHIPLIRYPGGNFVSSFNWEDSVGPKERRPRRLDLAWRTVEPNEFGLHEFMTWIHAVGAEPMMALNLGTRGIDAAMNLVEYCNHPGGTYWSDLRISHGVSDPYGVSLWCLGNEMDGPWQVGQKTADEYGRVASETAKALKIYDPNLELSACGSSISTMPTFPQWEAAVLEHTYDYVDYISLHQYFTQTDDDLDTYLGSSIEMDRFINTVIAACDFVQSKKRSGKPMYLSFDEWNVWYHSLQQDKQIEPWSVGPPLLEDVYTIVDALVVGCALNTLLKHADRIKIACLAQLVNVIAPIMTEQGGGAWAQTIYWPFYYVSRYGRGTSMQVSVDVPVYENKTHGEVPYVDASAVLSENRDELVLFLVNRHQVDIVPVRPVFFGIEVCRPVEWVELAHTDLNAVNSAEKPERVAPRNRKVSGAEQDFGLKPLSWNMVRFAKERL